MAKKRGKRMKQALTTPPTSVKGGGASGKKKSAGHAMGGLFGGMPKNPEQQNQPRTRAGEARSKQARMKRLENRFI